MTSKVFALLLVVSNVAHLCAADGIPTVQAEDGHNSSELFKLEYSLHDPSFCLAGACIDVDRLDGKSGQQRVFFTSSRKTNELSMVNAFDGKLIWKRRLEGDQQSICAYDLNGDGQMEILYSVSGPGRLYILDLAGNVLRQWDSGDHKLGNSAVVIDTDGDGVLEGFFGTRSKDLIRLNMNDLSVLVRRQNWGGQCGCHTSAMDVDHDGEWDLFAGSGDDSIAKGILHRYEPASLESVWSYSTNDNASSADPVLVDIDNDGQVEVIKSVDNYASDDAHDAVHAFETNGEQIWKVEGFSGEDSPNVADIDGDGFMDLVGMTFGNEVYRINHRGQVVWRKDLRPDLGLEAHAYLAPILCDLNGDGRLEILAMTNGGYFDEKSSTAHSGNGIVFALSPEGEVLSQFDLGSNRFWGEAFLANVDSDPQMELILSGSGGVDVIETSGWGTNDEYFQRRRTYQRLNVYSWCYLDSYFDRRGKKENVRTQTDCLVLEKMEAGFVSAGRFLSKLCELPSSCQFTTLNYLVDVPTSTAIVVNVLNSKGDRLASNVQSGAMLTFTQPIRLEFQFRTDDPSRSPRLDFYSLKFDQIEK